MSKNSVNRKAAEAKRAAEFPTQMLRILAGPADYADEPDMPTEQEIAESYGKENSYMSQKNSFGIESHPSDKLIHWGCVNRAERNTKSWNKFLVNIQKLRDAWDLLHGTPELSNACGVLMDWANDLAWGNNADDAAGESL